jgi:ABC-2 type transport system ATP-binding protein
MCTHDIFRAKEVADQIGIMKEGRLVMLKNKAEFLSTNLKNIYLNYMRESFIIKIGVC